MGTVSKLFITLQARYGNQWANQWDDERLLRFAKHEWFEALKHFSVDDIKSGLKSYCGDYPPNLAQFVKACEPVGKAAPYHRLWHEPDDVLKIEASKPDDYKEQGNGFLAKIREIIGA